MALQGDGNGIVTIPLWTATGDFSITGEFEKATVTEIFLGYDTGGSDYLGLINNNTVSLIIDGASESISAVPNGIVAFTLSRTGSLVSYDFAGVTGSYTAVGVWNLDRFLTYNNGSLKYRRKLSGLWTMIGGAGGTRTYNMEGSGLTLVDTTSAQNGTLSGFTTGGFTTPAASITITSVVDNQFIKEDVNHQAVFSISGGITGTPPTSVEYQLDGDSWQVLDASPTASGYSGVVTVTKEQDLSVRFNNDTGVTATVSKLKAAFVIAAWGQSNEQGAGVNNQSLTVDSGKPTPAMYVQGVYSSLVDPTNFAGSSPAGSTWPRIAKQFSDAGVVLGIANVAEGGSAISAWSSIGMNFNRIKEFATAVGGLSLAVSIIGESDANMGTETAAFKTGYLNPATELNTLYGVDVFATYFPVGTSTGTTENVNKIRAAYDALILENSFVKFGGDLSVIDISSGTNPQNDNLHLKLDADLTTGANIRYEAFTFVESTITLSITGIPDGTFLTTLITADRPSTLIESVDRVYSGGSSTFSVNVPASTQMYGVVRDNLDPSTDGAAINAVTV